MKETAIDIFGIHLQEPVTVLTNILIVVTCAILYFKLNLTTSKPELKKHWRLFFVFFGTSALIGAFAHGFKSYFAEETFYYIWMLMNLSGIPITYFLHSANIELSDFTDKTKQLLHYIILAIILVFVVITILTNNFASVKINGGIAILFTIIVHVITWRKKVEGSGWIAFGFIFSISTMIIHTAKLSLSDWFNFKDISHVFMNIALFMIYAGVVRKLRAFPVK